MPTNVTRPTIGVLAGWQFYWTATPLSYLNPIFRGIRQAAKELDCNLLLACGMGPSAASSDPMRPAWPTLAADTDFVPIGPWNTDGLIAVNPLHSAARSHYLHEVEAAGHPVVYIASGEQGAAIIADNAGGIHAAIRHLVDHGHRHIAFIAGSPDDLKGDSGARLHAYRATLHAFGLPADPHLVAYGRHMLATGYAAMQQIIASGEHFSAVCASNDESALGAMQALREAGRRVPDDVAVIGFDDRPEGSAYDPTLSSVHVPLFLMGYRAVELLRSRIDGAAAPALPVTIPTHLVPRESCGCGRLHVRVRDVESPGPPFDRTTIHSQLAARMAAAILAETHQLGIEEVRDRCRQLIAGFGQDLEHPGQPAFRRALDCLLRQALAEGDEIDLWQNAISILADSLPGWVANWAEQGARTQAYELLDYARVAISTSSGRRHRKYVVDQRWTVDRIGLLTAQLLAALDEAEVYQALAQHLPLMDITLAAVAELAGEGDDPVAWSTLRAVLPAGLPPVRCATREFPPIDLVGSDQAWSLALVPLVSGQRQLGYVAFDTAQLSLYGAIVQQVAAALNTAQLYRDAMEGRRLAEEANQVKSRFLSTVSHELRTPLNLIAGLSSILLHKEGENDAALPPAMHADVERIYANAQHLGALINDVLDLASSEAGQLRLVAGLVDLGQVVHTVAKTGRHLAQAKGLAWREQLPAAGPWVWGDRTRLQQVVLNLISNAVKFTAQGEVSLDVALAGEQVTVTVGDTGIGIAADEQQAIFAEFRRSERSMMRGYSGLGLGLAICKRLVELHGGSLSVSSSGIEGAGSQFCFTLPTRPTPVNQDPIDPVVAPALASEPDQAFDWQWPTVGTPVTQRTVLVVDDDLETLELHARIVQAHSPGNRVLRAHSGREALAIMAHIQVNLVLLDLAMPDLDGFGVLETMRAQESTRDVPVIVVTGQVLSEAEMARLNQGVTAVMGKGLYSLDETLVHLESALAHKRKLNSEAQRLVRKAMAYLHEHYAEPLTRHAIAQHVGLDEDYLTYCFRQELGITPITYLNRCRINHARHLLKQTGESVTAIALQVGFSDSGYFSRVFRREAGVSPEAFRRT
jgi:signal transduction histidine kinase/DNA-binding LacI/PurR family transcriptional regulator/AraC-like DNA-binding protein